MAERCSACGSADTSTGLHTYTCLICGAETPYAGLSEKGAQADNVSHYGDTAVYEGGGGLPNADPVAKPAKPAKKKK